MNILRCLQLHQWNSVFILRPHLDGTSFHIQRNTFVAVWTFFYLTTVCTTEKLSEQVPESNLLILQPLYRLCKPAKRNRRWHHGPLHPCALGFQSNSRGQVGEQQTTVVDDWAVFMLTTPRSLLRLLHRNADLLQHYCDQWRPMAMYACFKVCPHLACTLKDAKEDLSIFSSSSKHARIHNGMPGSTSVTGTFYKY